MKLALVFRPLCPWTTGYSYLNAMRHLNLDVTHIDNRDMLERGRRVDEFDAVLMVDDGFALQRYKMPLTSRSAFIGIDYHNGFEQHYKPNLDQFTHIYAANWTNGVQMLKSHGIQSQWLPVAYDPIGMPYNEPERRSVPVCFVAHRTTERRNFLSEIVEHKWQGIARAATWGDMAEILCNSRIAFNDSGRKSDGNTDNDIVNMRTFEILGCGALMFHRRAEPGIPDYELLGLHPFEGWWMSGKPEQPWTHAEPRPDCNWVSWTDWTQIEYTYNYFQANPRHAREIAERGRRWVQNFHTYTHRVVRVMCDMFGVEDTARELHWNPQAVLQAAYAWRYDG